MAALQPEEIIVNPNEYAHQIGELADQSKCSPKSPDGVEGLQPTAAANSECESDEDESVSESEEEGGQEEEEAMPDGNRYEDLHALLAFSKSRIEKTLPRPHLTLSGPVSVDSEKDAPCDEENSERFADMEAAAGEDAMSAVVVSPMVGKKGHLEEKKIDIEASGAIVDGGTGEEPVVKDQSYYVELAIRKKKEATVTARNDEGLGYLLKLAEKEVEEAQTNARMDEEQTGENVIQPAMDAKPTRSENSELWALLNYSKMRLETGSTPQVGRKSGSKAGSKPSSVRGDDNQSVSSKLSKSSKRSLGSRKSITKAVPVSVVGDLGDFKPQLPPNENEKTEKSDAPILNFTDTGDASVDGSVSLESGTKNSVANEDDSKNSDDEEEESSDEEDEEEDEDELPDFLKDNEGDGADPEDVRAMYEAAKYKAASIISVSQDKLTDVQMLQAIAIAEEAARKGDEKFSTRRSLFKLNEAKVEDLKCFLKDSFISKNTSKREKVQKKEREAADWGIGRGRWMKKLGAVVQDFRERCEEIDDRKKQEREGKPTNKEMFSAAMLDLKAQIEEYERIVKTNRGNQNN